MGKTRDSLLDNMVCSIVSTFGENCQANTKASPVCRKEIFTSVLDASDVAEDAEIKNQKNIRSSDQQPRQKTEAPLDKEPQEIESDPESESEEEDISLFRRVARELLDRSIRLRSVIRERGSSPYEALDPSKTQRS
jgi:hypothetical protein